MAGADGIYGASAAHEAALSPITKSKKVPSQYETLVSYPQTRVLARILLTRVRYEAAVTAVDRGGEGTFILEKHVSITSPLKRYLARDITPKSATAGEGSHCSLDETK